MERNRFQSNRFEAHKVIYDREDKPVFDSESKVPSMLSEEAKAEIELFDAVRAYIRDNDVNEFAVAAHFDIPVSRVKEWIREGRIEYKELSGTITSEDNRCAMCGKPITFGNICSRCKREQTGKREGHLVMKSSEDAGKMRFHHDE